jgi:hypothetical protein
MTTKRTPVKARARPRVTERMVDLFARGRAIYAALGDKDLGDLDGAQRDEYLDILNELHVLVGLETWHIADRVLFDEDYEPSDDENEIMRVRAALEQALEERVIQPRGDR